MSFNFLSQPAFSLASLSYGAPYPSRTRPVAPLVDPRTGDELLTTTDAARLVAMSPRTLEAYRRKGGGPQFVALSRNAVRYRRSDIDTWVRERVASHTAHARAVI